jgi:hypothetical protein
VLELETYKLFWAKMKKRNHNISVAKMNPSDNKSLRQFAESLFGKFLLKRKKFPQFTITSINQKKL